MRLLPLMLAVTGFAVSAGGGEFEQLPAALLQATAQDGRGALGQLALRSWLLQRHGRLLPEPAAPALLDALAEALSRDQAPAELETCPPADELVLHEDRLEGGNFRYIDHLVGLERRAIALDRLLPLLVVPLSVDVAAVLEQRQRAFQATPEAAALGARADRLHLQPVHASFVADGLALRPYAGRADDWYFHLVQEGTAATQLQFYSILEAWPTRAYHPLTGVGTPAAVPPLWFSPSDLLSHGAAAAVSTALHGGGALGRNPFAGFALRVLPWCGEQWAALEPGAELGVPAAALEQARAQRQRLAPPVVPPLFHDPARFLGARARPEWIQVKERSAPAFRGPEPELPVHQPTLEDARELSYWEDADAAALEPGPVAAPAAAAALAPASPAVPGCRVAILLPTVEEAEAYIQAIAANEVALADNAAALGRALLLGRWAEEAGALLEEDAAELRAECLTAQLHYRAEVARLRRERFVELAARAQARRPLERVLREERLPALRALQADVRGL